MSFFNILLPITRYPNFGTNWALQKTSKNGWVLTLFHKQVWYRVVWSNPLKNETCRPLPQTTSSAPGLLGYSTIKPMMVEYPEKLNFLGYSTIKPMMVEYAKKLNFLGYTTIKPMMVEYPKKLNFVG